MDDTLSIDGGALHLYIRYPIVTRAFGIAKCAREQRYLACKLCICLGSTVISYKLRLGIFSSIEKFFGMAMFQFVPSFC